MSLAAGTRIPESKRVQRVQGTAGAIAPQCPGFGPGTASPSGLVQRGVLYAAWGSENHTTALAPYGA